MFKSEEPTHFPTQFKQGLVIGRFAPLTLGHINLINYASTLCEEVLVILSFDTKWLEKQPGRDQRILTLKNRLRWLKQAYHDIPQVKITFVDESNILGYPEGWSAFAHLIYAECNRLGYQPDAMFSSELAYDQICQQYFDQMKHIIVDANRTNVPISASQIRHNLIKNWGYLPSVVRQDYVKKVCIIGIESCGKTTMTKYLAKQFNTSWVEEYGRTYIETVLCNDEFLLQSSDYVKIAIQQKYLEEQAAKTANNGILFCDTNAFITQFYHRLYEGIDEPVLAALALAEQYDLTLILGDNVPWVDDGLRKFGSKAQRNLTAELFGKMLKEYCYDNKFVLHINAPHYNERLQIAIAAVNTMLNSTD